MKEPLFVDSDGDLHHVSVVLGKMLRSLKQIIKRIQKLITNPSTDEDSGASSSLYGSDQKLIHAQ